MTYCVVAALRKIAGQCNSVKFCVNQQRIKTFEIKKIIRFPKKNKKVIEVKIKAQNKFQLMTKKMYFKYFVLGILLSKVLSRCRTN